MTAFFVKKILITCQELSGNMSRLVLDYGDMLQSDRC